MLRCEVLDDAEQSQRQQKHVSLLLNHVVKINNRRGTTLKIEDTNHKKRNILKSYCHWKIEMRDETYQKEKQMTVNLHYN